MVKPPSFDRYGMKKGAWSQDEDDKLRACIDRFGHTNWRLVPVAAGLKRCGKSCRLRWKNYLMPGLKRGNFTKDEEDLIIELHNQLGNKWSAIAAHFPDRTDNDIKNYFHAHIKKRRGVRPEIVRQEEEAENISGAESISDMGIDLSQLSLKEEIYDHLGLCQNDIISELLCDYSDSGIGPWNYSNLWSEAVGEEDFFDMELW